MLLALVERTVGEWGQMQRMQLDLIRDQRKTAGQQVELHGGEVGHAEVTHLSHQLQVRERLGHHVGVHQRIRTVEHQQIELLHLQVAQRMLDTADDVCKRGVVVLQAVRRPMVRRQADTAFAGELHPVAQ